MSWETAKEESGLTVDTLYLLLRTELAHLTAMAEAERTRVDQSIQASDLRYSQRFEAQGLALSAAATAAKEAVAAALTSQQQAAAEQKETTTKHFEQVNHVNTQAQLDRGTYIQRPEFSAEIKALGVRVDDLSKVLAGKIDALSLTSQRTEGEKGGASEKRDSLVQAVTLFIAIAGLVVAAAVAWYHAGGTAVVAGH